MRDFRSGVLALALLLPATAGAATVRPILLVHGGWSSYRMTDANALVATVNETFGGAGLHMDDINSGPGLGIAGGIAFPGGSTLTVGYERLAASSSVGDATGRIDLNFPGNVVRIAGAYAFPARTAFKPRLGGSLGLVSEAGSATLSGSGSPTLRDDLEGTGPLAELFAGGDFWATPQFAIGGSLGYRFARVAEIEDNGRTLYNQDGSQFAMDFSGVFVRIELTVALVR